jgi:hypothetical protein
MPQANSENSTSMPAVSTRRRFLSQAACVAAGGTVLALATSPPALATAAPAGSLAVPGANSDVVEIATSAAGPVPTMAELRSWPFDYGSFPEYPPEIFGKLPSGFVLDEQPCIETLCFWHRKAIDILDQPFDDDEKLSAYCAIKNRILGAVLSARPTTPGQAAAQLRAVVAEIDSLSTETSPASIEEVLDIHDVVKLSADLNRTAAPITPKKNVGAFEHDGKLTREGLLARYQSFLVQELQTVSWNLYGERDFAKQFVCFDHAVQQRCNSTDHDGPFFDEGTLPDRARAVLNSLKIDAEAVVA